MMTAPNDEFEARFSCKLIQQTLDNHNIQLTQLDSYEIDMNQVQNILDEVDR
jgi:hypothetical protein